MSVLLQLSDPHFGTEQPALIEALHALVASQRPDVLLLSGDITQRARPAQFAAARALVDSLNIPHCLALPGNHDIPLFNPLARLCWPYANYLAAFGPELEPVLERDDLLLIGVNTTRPWRHKHGEVSAAQIAAVAQRLQQARRGQLCVVATHQPLHVITARDRRNLLRGHVEALASWTAAGAQLFLGGHIHLPYVRALPGGSWVAQAGTGLSRRVRAGAPNSVNLIRCGAAADEQGCLVEQWDCLPGGDFILIRQTRLPVGSD
jgi:3',5'-cyclic AMP phosphodiesterase CpdA